MIKIVILGGGFAGVAAAKTILGKTKRSEVQVTVIDKNSYHLFTPSMYEVAASEEPKKNICIPLSEILKGAEIISKDIKKIDELNYDYLIVALGSEPDFHDIPGLSEYSIPFKNLDDAVKIKNLVKEKIKEKSMVRVLVGGGGASGCEFAAELIHHIKKGLKISLIQKSPQLIKELKMPAAEIAYKRLLKKDVEFCFGERITRVFKDRAETDKNDDHGFDVFVWAGGVKPSSIAGKMVVNEYMQVQGSENIFACGDVAFLSENLPQTVRVAREEGEVAGENVVHKMKSEPLKAYKFKNQIFVVPLVGKYAVVQFNNIIIKGFIAWVIQQFIFLRYLLGILPPMKAFRKWNKFEMYLVR